MDATKQKVQDLSFKKDSNYPVNAKYLQLHCEKFWYLVEEQRHCFQSETEVESEAKDFNIQYIKAKNVPPLSAMRIKEGAGYSSYKNFIFQ